MLIMAPNPNKNGKSKCQVGLSSCAEEKKIKEKKEENSEEGIKPRKCLMTSSGTPSISKLIHQQFLGCAGEGSGGWEQGGTCNVERRAQISCPNSSWMESWILD